MKIVLAQLNPIVGNISYNSQKIKAVIQAISNQNVDLIVFPELIISGYPPLDLLTYPSFIQSCHNALSELIESSKTWGNLHIIVGTPYQENNLLLNAACLIGQGSLKQIISKQKLPNYDIFNESRYFAEKKQENIITLNGKKLGVLICEDAWPETPQNYHHPAYLNDPINALLNKNLDVIIHLSASPFEQNKHQQRLDVLSKLAIQTQTPIISVNQIGANDGIIFEGRSAILSQTGQLITQLKAFQEDIKTITFPDCLTLNSVQNTDQHWSDIQNIYEALVLGIRDYAYKTGFSKAILGLSGGIDSAIVAVLATEALGKENVLGVTMPSNYSSEGSINDSFELAKTLQIECLEIPISPMVSSFLETMRPSLSADTYTEKGQMAIEENLQPRVRGTVLMGIANKEQRLLLNTGNKSELAVGYCTLYGDMNGALSVIGDLYKTQVYELASFINKQRTIIPNNTITKAPSAELKPNQKDQDTLPDYSNLDSILKAYVEERKSISEIIKSGQDPQTVEWVIKTVNLNEFKRFQAPPILKISKQAFGTGRRMPIAASYMLK